MSLGEIKNSSGAMSVNSCFKLQFLLSITVTSYFPGSRPSILGRLDRNPAGPSQKIW